MDKNIIISGASTNALLCRQELDATTKKFNKESEHKSKTKRHHQGNSSHHSKPRGNLNHPKIPPPPPPDKVHKSINYALRQDNIEEMTPLREPQREEISTTAVGEIDNMAFIKHGQKELEKDIKNVSMPVHPHQRHLSNSQYVITSTSASSNVNSSSFGYEGIRKEDYSGKSILKTSSYKDGLDERRAGNMEKSDILLSGLELLLI